MAHNLNYSQKTGTWSFASNSEKAWHGLGQVVEQAMTSEEAIKLANLDYEVAKTTIHAKINANPDDEISLWQPIDDKFATYRTDTYETLGIVGNRYEIVQNKDAFGFFDSIIDKGEAIFETAGAIGKGEKIFLTAKLPDDLMIGGEKIEKYLMLTNSHDGSSSILAGLTHVRIVCNNTLQAALRSMSNKVTIQHNAGANERLKEAHRVMGISSKYSAEVYEIFNRMTEVKMNESQYRDYIFKVLKPEFVPKGKTITELEMSTRLKNTVDSTLEFALTHPTQITEESNGTLWGAYNSISGYYNYIKSYKKPEDKLNTQFFGLGNTKMLKSFDLALEMMEN